MWIRSHNGHLYAYEAVRRGGRPAHRYIGRVDAEMAERMLAADAENREARAERRRRSRAAFEAERRRADGNASAVDAGARSALEAGRAAIRAAGYHLHKRQWRRRRAMPAEIRPIPVGAVPRPRGAMARAVEDQLLGWATDGEDRELMEELRADIARVEGELAGPDPTPAEALLAESAAQAWFLHRWLEYELAGQLRHAPLAPAQEEQRQRRIDRAQRRFLDLVRMIATLRRLTLPDLQVNIANIGTPTPRARPTCARLPAV